MLTLLEPLISSATESLATVIFDIVRTSGGKLIQTYSDRRVIAKASNEYARKYAERHGILRVLGMREPVPLESVYTEVQFLSEWEHQRFATVEVLEEAFRQDSKRSFQSATTKTQDGLVVAEDKQYLVVLGEPGVGKSTFLKKTGLEALKGLKSKQTNSKNKQIPVFIERMSEKLKVTLDV